MQTFIKPVNVSRGAPMGRYTGPDFLDVDAGPLYLRWVRLDSGGYDAGGAYWGIGPALWECLDQDGNGRIFRAATREKAKALIRADFESARFYR